MLKLNNIGAPRGANRDKKRRGRGPASGTGKTGGRGHKGQKARSGAKQRAWFEGGQMPINRRLPKRGFKNPFRKDYQIVNLRDLSARFADGGEVNATSLWEKGLVSSPEKPIKLLGDGSVTVAFQIEVDKASKSAAEAIQAAGGQLTVKS